MIVGFANVLQQTPLAVTDVPPSEVMLPPPVAVVSAIFETGVVVRVGVGTGEPVVENVRSLP